jgi:signal transduction histidine kinase
MRKRWKRINFRIKHQLYLRILPVVVLSVLAVGLFSGRLLTNRAINTYLEQRTEETAAILADLMGRVSVRSLALEARKEEILPANAGGGRSGAQFAGPNLKGFLALDDVCGASLLRWDAPPGERTEPRFILAGGLDSPENRQRLRAWTRWVRDRASGGAWLRNKTPLSWPDGPRVVDLDGWHCLWIFPPLTLACQDPASAGSPFQDQEPRSLLPALPVLVGERNNKGPSEPVVDLRPGGRGQLIVLLDLASLAEGCSLTTPAPGDVEMLLSPGGRLMVSNVDTLKAGLDLAGTDQHVFRGVAPGALGDFLARGDAAGAHTYLGSRWNPYIFMVDSRPDLPLLLVSTMPFSQVHGGLLLYTAIVVLMATIALLGSILVIMQVGERLSNRLQDMSAHMRDVASGDYTRRMPEKQPDEVGRLISYFNVMSASLEGAHSELREKTQRLGIALARMKRLDKAKDDFLALISHEVRTPLTSIMGGIDFLRVVLSGVSADQQHLLDGLRLPEITDIIDASGRRLRDFMNDAILMSSLQSSDTRLVPAPVPLADLCELVLSSLQSEIAARRLVVVNELQPSEWSLLCDRNLMLVALEKLLRNAVQHNEEGGRVRIALVDEIPGLGAPTEVLGEKLLGEFALHPAFADWQDGRLGWQILLLHNTGPVIPADKRESLFNKFEIVGRIENHQKGSGLSLPIVRAVLENHGGRIHVESQEGAGNFFYLVLPVVAVCADAPDLRHESGQGEIGAPGDEEIDLVRESAPLEVELEHART